MEFGEVIATQNHPQLLVFFLLCYLRFTLCYPGPDLADVRH